MQSIRSRKSFAVAGVMLSVTLFTLSLTGCTSIKQADSSSSGQSFNNEAGMQKEYRTAAARLKLPPGIVFPKKANAGGAQAFEKRVGLGHAEIYWMYAWETEWLEQRGKDEARERAALAVLKNEVPKSATMVKGSDEATKRFYDEYLRKAELGDPSGFQSDVELNGLKMQRTNK